MPNLKKQNASIAAGARVDLAGGRETTNQIQHSDTNTNLTSMGNKSISVLTMCSRDLANLTDKQHQHVKRDIENMLSELGEDVSKFGRIYMDSMSRQQTEYVLDRELTETLLTGYSAVLRRKVIARWRELEASSSLTGLPDFTNPAASARAWADQVEAREALRLELADAAPAVEFVQAYVDCTGLKSFRQACKLIGANERLFRDFLIEKSVMYLLGREWMPYATHLAAGRFKVKAGKSDVNGHAFNSALFTPKGVNWAAGEFAKYQLEQRL